MPMTISGMQNDIKTAVIAQFGAALAPADLDKMALAIATAVVTHIQTNAVVVNAVPASPGPVTIT